MKLRTVSSFASVAFLAAAASAQYTTGFESPLFSSGQISGQDSWTTATNQSTARVLTATEIENELTAAGWNPGTTVHSGSQALYVSGTAGSSATVRLISGLSTENNVMLDIWARPLQGGTLGNIFLTMEDSSGDRAAAFRFGPGQSIDYGTNVAAIWQASGSQWAAETWYHLTLSVDYVTKTYDLAIDGTKVNVDPIPFYSANSDNFAQVRIFRGSGQAGMIVDDLKVAAVPEPAAITCLLAGGSVLFFRRRRLHS